MTPEEYYKVYNQPQTVLCVDCGSAFEISKSGYNSIIRRNPNNPQFRCKSCMKLHRKKMMTERMANMSEDDKRKMYESVSDKKKEFWNNVPKDRRNKILEKLNEGSKNWRENETDEERERISKIHSDSNRRRWDQMTQEEKDAFNKKCRDAWNEKVDLEKFGNGIRKRWENLSNDARDRISMNMSAGKKRWWENIDDETLEVMKLKISGTVRNYWNGLPDSIREAISEREKLRWENLPDTEKKKISEYMAKVSLERWKYLSEDQQNNIVQALRSGNAEYWDGLSDEDRTKLSELISARVKEYWGNLPDTEKEAISLRERNRWANLPMHSKEELTRKKLQGSGIRNNSNSRFEEKFNQTLNQYGMMFVPEYCTTSESMHFWDYGIFNSDGELLAVVDLDGAYFHADICDYDGMHSKEEYDEKRGISIDGNTKIFIIYEKQFNESFKYMAKYVNLSYDEYRREVLKEFKSQPFPYQHHRDFDLMKSYDILQRMNPGDKYHEDLSLNTRQGDWLIMEFHHSIYHDNQFGKISPYELWSSGNMFDIIKSNMYHSDVNPNKILQGFNSIRVSVFSAGRAKMIISRYLSEYTEVFDPFSGYSGRMLGTISLGKKYVGQDISEQHVIESNNLMDFLHKYEVKFDASVVQEDILRSSGKYECLFTCPPYGDEEYEDVPFDDRSCDDWIDECLNRFNCKKYLFVVNETSRYSDKIVYTIKNRSVFAIPEEYIILIDK